MTEFPGLYQPAWALPAGVHAFVTTRQGGHSRGAWDSFNLALHVDDDTAAVSANRDLLAEQMGRHCGTAAPGIQWVQQVHGTAVLHADTVYEQTLAHSTKTLAHSTHTLSHHTQTAPHHAQTPPQADAIYGTGSKLALGILTADCLPVLFCADDGSEIAVAHAGWRGLLGGVLEATLASFSAAPTAVRIWLGPAIGPCHFEVGEEVRAAFLSRSTTAALADTQAAFRESAAAGKWLADIYQLARIRLRARGVENITGEVECTCCNTDRFYSYRQHHNTGRFATLILKVS